jgi:hypothetical protein
MVASQQMQDERFADAQVTLLPLANSPHSSALTEAASGLLDKARAGEALKARAATRAPAVKSATK